MSYEHYIGVIDEESVMAECGPMRLVIRAMRKGQPQIELACRAATESFGYLERVAKFRPRLSQPAKKFESLPEDRLIRCMVQNACALDEDNLTPMATVAGSIADAVADWLFDRGATKVIVDNGGDIAIRLAPDETTTVGVRSSLTVSELSHVIALNANAPSWGVTTSGLGGRSLTRGIASAVTTLATNASIADAAATVIANTCFVEDERIIQSPAELVDPNTDLGGIEVTTHVGPLSPEKISLAIDHARQRAESFIRKGLIVGALIALKDRYALTDGMRNFTVPVRRHIDSVLNHGEHV